MYGLIACGYSRYGKEGTLGSYLGAFGTRLRILSDHSPSDTPSGNSHRAEKLDHATGWERVAQPIVPVFQSSLYWLNFCSVFSGEPSGRFLPQRQFHVQQLAVRPSGEAFRIQPPAQIGGIAFEAELYGGHPFETKASDPPDPAALTAPDPALHSNSNLRKNY